MFPFKFFWFGFWGLWQNGLIFWGAFFKKIGGPPRQGTPKKKIKFLGGGPI